MKLPEAVSLQTIAALINAEILGQDNQRITGINEIHKVEIGDLTFADHPKYRARALKSPASVVIVNERVDCPLGKSLLLCDAPFAAYNKLVRHFYPSYPLSASISDTAVIHPSAIIEPNVVVGHRVRIGAYTHLRANTTIHADTIIGEHVLIHSGTVVGADAFYFKWGGEGYDKLMSCGRVRIEDEVEIGACCTIDRGVSGETIIGKGSKLDNQVHVGHGVVIGQYCLIAAQVGIAGKTILEDRVKLWGQVGIAARLTIGEGAEVYAQSGVPRNLKGNKAYFGTPAVEAQEWFRDYRITKRLARDEHNQSQ